MRIFVRIFVRIFDENIWWEYPMDHHICLLKLSSCENIYHINIHPHHNKNLYSTFQKSKFRPSYHATIFVQQIFVLLALFALIYLDLSIWEKHRKNCECCPFITLDCQVNKDCHEFRFSIVRIVISVSIVTSLQDCLVSQLWAHIAAHNSNATHNCERTTVDS